MPLEILDSLCGFNAVFSVPATIPANVANSVSTVNTEAVIFHPSEANLRYRIGSVAIGFAQSPPAGTALEVRFGTRLAFRLLLTTPGPHYVPILPPIVGEPGESLEVRTTTGSMAIRTSLNANVWTFSESSPY